MFFFQKANFLQIFIFISAVKLSSIASALILLAAVWIRCRSPFKVSCFAAIYTVLSGYIIVLAVMSPSPPLSDSTAGAVFVVGIQAFDP